MKLRDTSAALRNRMRAIAQARLDELCIMYGIGSSHTGDDRNALKDSVNRALDTIEPHLSPERPAFTAIIPFVWKPIRPYAVGANVSESAYSEARFSLSIALTEERPEPLVVLAILRQADARTAHGGIYLHNLMAGVRQRAYVYDAEYNLKASIDPRITRRKAREQQ